MDTVFLKKIEAAPGYAALQQHTVLIIRTVMDLGVLGQVGQNTAIGDAGFHFSVEGAVEQGERGELDDPEKYQ